MLLISYTAVAAGIPHAPYTMLSGNTLTVSSVTTKGRHSSRRSLPRMSRQRYIAHRGGTAPFRAYWLVPPPPRFVELGDRYIIHGPAASV